MKTVGLNIKDGKITTDDGKEIVLVYVDVLERLQEQLESAQDVIYEYIKIYGVERECSKYLEKYAKRTK